MAAEYLKAATAGDLPALEALHTGAECHAHVDADGKTALHLAAFEGHEAAAAFLLAQGAPVDGRTKKGLTPFHYAIFKGHLGVARALAAASADVRAVDGQERSALHLACTAGALPPLLYLAEELGQCPLAAPASSDGMNCAHFAALLGHVEVLEWLRAWAGGAGAALLTAKSPGAGVTPLHLAVMKGHAPAVSWLVESAGADVNAEEGKGRTPLHIAVAASSAPLVAYLLHAGADARRVDKAGDSLEKLARSVVVSRGSSSGSSGAASAGSAERVRELVAAALAPPTVAPGVPSLLSLNDSAELGAEATLPAPAFGRDRDRVFLRWAQSEGGPGCPCTGYGLQWAPRGSMLSLTQSWRDAALAVLPGAGEGGAGADAGAGAGAEEGGAGASPAAAAEEGAVEVVQSTLQPFACVQGLPAASPVNFRVRARNANGWGPWSARSEEIVTAAAAAAPAATSGAAASAAAAAAPAATAATAATPSAAAAGGGAALLDDALQGGSALATATAGASSPASDAPPLDVALIEAVCSGRLDTLAELALTLPLTSIDSANSRTLLHHAANSGQLGSLLWLLSSSSEAGAGKSGSGGGLPSAMLEARDALGATPLLLAVVAGHLPLIKALSARGSSLNMPDSKGFSPLHYAALKGRPYIFRWLLEAGAEPSARTLDGKSVRQTVEGMAVTAAAATATPTATATTTTTITPTMCDELRSYLGNAECLPLAPPQPTYLMSTHTTISLALPLPKWAPGSPLPYGFEVQVALRSGFAAALTLAWSTVIEVAPTGVNICAPPYCAGGGGAAAAAERSAAAATAASAAASSGEGGAGSCAPAATATAAAAPAAPLSDPAIPSPLPFTPACVVVTNLTPSTNYAFQIRALSAKGVGLWSPRTADLATLAVERPLAPEIAAAAAATATAAGTLAAALRPRPAAAPASSASATSSAAATATAASAAGAAAAAAPSPATGSTPAAPAALHSTSYLLASLAALKHLKPPMQSILAALRGEKFTPAPLPTPSFGSPAKASDATPASPAAAAATDRSLLACCIAGNVEEFQALAAQHSPLELCSQGALHGAMLGGSVALVEALLAALSSSGCSAEDVCAAVSAFAPPAAEQAGWGPLHFATSPAALATLAASPLAGSEGSSLAAWLQGDAQGVTPAHLAAHSDNPALLHALRGLCGAPRGLLWCKDKAGLAPIHYAAAGNAGAAVSYLLWAAKGEGVGASRVQDALRRSPREVAREAGAAQAEKVLDAWEALR